MKAKTPQTIAVIRRGVKPHRLRFEAGDQAMGDQTLGLLTGVEGRESCCSLNCNILIRVRCRGSGDGWQSYSSHSVFIIDRKRKHKGSGQGCIQE